MDENKEFDEVNVVTLTDEDGSEVEYEVIGSLEYDGIKYYALIPYVDDPDFEPEEYIVLRSQIEKNADGEDEEFLVSIEDDEEFDRIADIFDDEFADVDYDI